MTRINSSKKLFYIILAIVFAILFIANHYTFYIADDFGYRYHCQTHEVMTSLKDHITSIIYHTKGANGRYIAHFLAQYALNLPKEVFNVINALMFTLQIYLAYRISVLGKKDTKNCILLLAIFGATWVYEPLFGETNLWVMGSCNYLWGLVAVLGFMIPYFKLFVFDEKIDKKTNTVLFFILSFVAGAFTEATSAGGILVSGLLCLAYIIFNKKMIPKKYIVSMILAVIGYATVIFSPAEINAKTGNSSFYTIFKNFITCIKIYNNFVPMLIAYIILFYYAMSKKANNKKIISSIIMLIGSLFTNFIFTLAAYYPGRGACATTVFLICAVGILVTTCFEVGEKRVAMIIPAIILPVMCYNLVIGLDDIHFTNYQARLAIDYIEDCKANGIYEVKFPDIKSDTTYSAYHGMMPLNPDNPYEWPNNFMAQYFGVERLETANSIKDIPEIQEIDWTGHTEPD